MDYQYGDLELSGETYEMGCSDDDIAPAQEPKGGENRFSNVVCYDKTSGIAELFNGDYINVDNGYGKVEYKQRKRAVEDAITMVSVRDGISAGDINVIRMIVACGVGPMPVGLSAYRGFPLSFTSARSLNFPRLVMSLMWDCRAEADVLPHASFFPLSRAMMNDMAYLSGNGCIVPMTGKGHVLSGARVKWDGAPYWNVCFGNSAYMYGSTIFESDIFLPAFLERVNDVYHCLAPYDVVSMESVVVRNLEFTLDSPILRDFNEIMVRVDGVEYKVKDRPTVDLKAVGGSLYDASSKYRGPIDKKYEGIVEMDVFTKEIVKMRPDKAYAQTASAYKAIVNSVTVTQLLSGVRPSPHVVIAPMGGCIGVNGPALHLAHRPVKVIKQYLDTDALIRFVRTDYVRGVPFSEFCCFIASHGISLSLRQLWKIIAYVGGTLVADRVVVWRVARDKPNKEILSTNDEIVRTDRGNLMRYDLYYDFTKTYQIFCPTLVFAVGVSVGGIDGIACDHGVTPCDQCCVPAANVYLTRPPGAEMWDLLMMGLAKAGETNEIAWDREFSEEVEVRSAVSRQSLVVPGTISNAYGYIVYGNFGTGEGREKVMLRSIDLDKFPLRHDALVILRNFVKSDHANGIELINDVGDVDTVPYRDSSRHGRGVKYVWVKKVD